MCSYTRIKQYKDNAIIQTLVPYKLLNLFIEHVDHLMIMVLYQLIVHVILFLF